MDLPARKPVNFFVSQELKVSDVTRKKFGPKIMLCHVLQKKGDDSLCCGLFHYFANDQFSSWQEGKTVDFVKKILGNRSIMSFRRTLIFTLVLILQECHSFQSFMPKFSSPFPAFSPSTKTIPKSVRELENKLLEAIGSLGGRLANSEEINDLVAALENERSNSVPRPAIAPEVYGRWRLLYTTNADTASPIQRKAVDTTKFPIYQDITFNGNNQLVVSQVVKFSDTAELRVDALASTSAYPLPELASRKSTGEVFGLNILGVSLVGDEAEPDPTRPDSRIDFVFDEGNFDFGSFQLPYPVPFRLPLLRDWVKGWIDITWLSDRLRISRGNKGSTFILVKEDDN